MGVVIGIVVVGFGCECDVVGEMGEDFVFVCVGDGFEVFNFGLFVMVGYRWERGVRGVSFKRSKWWWY